MSQPEEKPIGDVLRPGSSPPEPGPRAGDAPMAPEQAFPMPAPGGERQPGDDEHDVDYESQDG